MSKTKTNHIVIYGPMEGVEGKIEKFCKLTMVDNERSLKETLDKEPVDLVLMAGRSENAIKTVRRDKGQGDVPILIVGHQKQPSNCIYDEGGCTAYVSSSEGISGMFAKAGQYLQIGKLLSLSKNINKNTAIPTK